MVYIPNFTQYLYKVLWGLDTLHPFFYYELLFIIMQVYTCIHKSTLALWLFVLIGLELLPSLVQEYRDTIQKQKR